MTNWTGKGSSRRPTAIPQAEKDLREQLWREKDEKKKVEMLKQLTKMVEARGRG